MERNPRDSSSTAVNPTHTHFNHVNVSIMQRASHFSRSTSEAVPWRSAIVGILAGLMLATVLLAPAVWLAKALSQMTAGRMQFIEPVGTVWTGSGRLLLTGGTGSHDSAVLPGRVDWKLRFDGLALVLELHAACCTPRPLQVRAQPRWRGISFQIFDGESEWPASVLTGLGAPWNTVQANGTLRLATHDLSLLWSPQQPMVAGQAKLTAVGLTSSLTTLKPMGSYQLMLLGGDVVEVRLVTIEGSLQLSGSGRWVGPRLTFEGRASAAPGYETALENLLNIIGRRSGKQAIFNLG